MLKLYDHQACATNWNCQSGSNSLTAWWLSADLGASKWPGRHRSWSHLQRQVLCCCYHIKSRPPSSGDLWLVLRVVWRNLAQKLSASVRRRNYSVLQRQHQTSDFFFSQFMFNVVYRKINKKPFSFESLSLFTFYSICSQLPKVLAQHWICIQIKGKKWKTFLFQ